jgi:hypothetical protein
MDGISIYIHFHPIQIHHCPDRGQLYDGCSAEATSCNKNYSTDVFGVVMPNAKSRIKSALKNMRNFERRKLSREPGGWPLDTVGKLLTLVISCFLLCFTSPTKQT